MNETQEYFTEAARIAEAACKRITGKSSDEWRLALDRRFVDDCRKGLVSQASMFTRELMDNRKSGLSRRWGLLEDDVEVVEVSVHDAKLTEVEQKIDQVAPGGRFTVETSQGKESREKKASLKFVYRYKVAPSFFARAWANVKAFESARIDQEPNPNQNTP